MQRPPQIHGYETLRRLGGGGQAEVFLAERLSDRGLVALRCAADVADSALLRAGLRHPGIVEALELGQADTGLALIEEYVAGPCWAEEPPSATSLGAQARLLLHALAYLHEHDVIHGDIKPANIIASASGPVLIDFGLAVRSGSSSRPSGTLGTVDPEELEGKSANPASDLFALGTTLLAISLGIAPRRRWSLEPESLRDDLERAPSKLAALLLGLCSPRSAERFASASAALDAIDAQPPMPSIESWPIVGRRASARRVHEWLQANEGARVVILHGQRGVGRRSFAQRLAGELRCGVADAAPEGTRIASLFDPTLDELASVADHFAKTPDGIALLTASSRQAVGAAQSLFDKVLVEELAPLTAADVASLTRYLPFGEGPERLHEATRGHPGAIAARACPSEDSGDELELRGQAIAAALGRDFAIDELHEQLASEVREALGKGLLALRRDGRVAQVASDRRSRWLDSLERDERQRLHGEIAQHLDSAEAKLHAFLSESAEQDAQPTSSLDSKPRGAASRGEASDNSAHDFCEELDALLRSDSDQLSTALHFLEQATRLGLTDRLRPHFAGLGRRLVDRSQLEVALRVIGEARTGDPSAALGLIAYLESERGRPSDAIDAARRALEIDADARTTRLDLARALQWLGRFDEALAEIETTLASSSSHEDDVEFESECERLRGLVLFRLGRHHAASAGAAAALQRIDRSIDDASMDSHRAEPSSGSRGTGEHNKTPVRPVASAKLERCRLGLLQNLAMFERHRGDLAHAAYLFDNASARLFEIADLRNACIVDINAAIVRQDLGQLDIAQELRARAYDRAAAAGLAQARDVALAGLGIGQTQRGSYASAVATCQRAADGLKAQGLTREARLAAAYANEARLAIRANPSVARTLQLELEALTEAGEWAIAAVLWRILLQAESNVEVDAHPSRRMLGAADRSTREQILVELSRRVLRSAEVPAVEEPPSSTAKPLGSQPLGHEHVASAAQRRLERLARSGLARTRALALDALAASIDRATARATNAREQRRRLAAGLLIHARHSRSPSERLRSRRRAIDLGAKGRSLLPHMLLDVAELEHDVSPTNDEVTMTWNQELAALRRTLEARLSSGPTSALIAFVRINRLLLDPEQDDPSRLRAILEEAMDMSQAARGMVLSFDASEGTHVVASYVRDNGGLVERRFDFSHSLLDEVLEQREPRMTVNAMEDPEWAIAPSVVDFRLSSIACVPILAGDSVLGAFYLDNPFEQGRFRPDTVEVLEAFATQISLGFEAARHRQEIGELNAQIQDELDLQTTRLDHARAELAVHERRQHIVYQSEQMARVMKEVRRLAATALPVHIHGATGTGKELIARRLHELSTRREAPFVSENCSAISEELLESELFGHVRGAFTGADHDKLGLFRVANGGTLFLDEIADMPLSLQARLLRVLQEGEVRPVGSDRVYKVDVRVITATHGALEELCSEGKFREDLYYRIVVAKVELPSLAERREDIPLLARFFLERHAPGRRFAEDAIEALVRRAWPGNVRQLDSVVRSVSALCDAESITANELPAADEDTQVALAGKLPLDLKQLERIAIERALQQSSGNRNRAAKLLGISRSSIFVKIKEYGLAGVR